MYGGAKSIDYKRITYPIKIDYPILISSDNLTNLIITRVYTNLWINNIKKKLLLEKKPLDVVYYDPPYNKHPYNIFYFMLDVINNWDKNVEIPDTNRGQSSSRTKSLYN